MTETVVVGGGLAGGAAATLLARAGRPVVLLEREREPVNKMCGEFLSGGAGHMLARLGVDLDRLGASSIATVRVMAGRRLAEAPLPFVARGLTRKRLDAALLDRAGATGARIERGTTVRRIEPGRLDTSAGSLAPGLLLLASGKHEVRGAARDTGAHAGRMVGFKMYFKLPARARAALSGVIAVALFEGGYAGMQLVEGGTANLCLTVDRGWLAAIGGDWPHLFARLAALPHLTALLDDAEPLLPRPLAIAGVPYGFLGRGPVPHGLFRLGDQAAVIPSFCGEGMAIALRSAFLAAGIAAAGGGGDDHVRAVRREFGRRLRIATALQRVGRHGWSQRLLVGTLQLSPGMAARLAALTRVPDR